MNTDGGDRDDQSEQRVPLGVVFVSEDGGERDGEERCAERPGPQCAHVGGDVPARVEQSGPRVPRVRLTLTRTSVNRREC